MGIGRSPQGGVEGCSEWFRRVSYKRLSPGRIGFDSPAFRLTKCLAGRQPCEANYNLLSQNAAVAISILAKAKTKGKVRMISACAHENAKKCGKNRNGSQRYQCRDCGTKFSDEPAAKPLGTMRIGTKQAELVLKMLLEGMSIRACERITGTDRNTICDLIATVGEKCHRFMDSAVKGVRVHDVQIDEIWSFVKAKQKTATARRLGPEAGDSWTYVAIERTTKLVIGYHTGDRSAIDTQAFLSKIRRSIVAGRFQLSSDGFTPYRYGVPTAFGHYVDYGVLVKTYAASQTETRYSPAQIIKAEKVHQYGQPDHDKICTSHVESFNQKFRMQVKRFARLTNAHSKSLKHHAAMQAIWFAFYNFCRKHDTIKTSPAVASGLTDHVWTIGELLEAAAGSLN